MTQFEDVTTEELGEETLQEQRAIIENFMAGFVDHEADALPLDVQIRRVLKQNMKRKTNDT